MANERIELRYPGRERKSEIKRPLSNGCLLPIKRVGQAMLDGWTNMLISGENLLALKSLLEQERIRGNVRLVYIDPPFGTNQEFRFGRSRTSTTSFSRKDEQAYGDWIVGPDYIEFLRKRLVLLRELLADDGSIYVHIDLKMGHYVKVLMDEIFGQERFVNDITRVKCNPKNFDRKGYGNIKDMILFYTKTGSYVWHDQREEISEQDVRRLFPRVDAEGRRYTTTPLHAPGETRSGVTGKPWKGIKPPRGRHWRYPPAELEKLDGKGLIEWSCSGNPRKKIYAEDALSKGKKRQDIWHFKDPPYPSYPTEKNLEMLKVIVMTSTNPGDLVLDCFSGSGTTLVAAEELGRRWIGIDKSQRAVERTISRISNMGNPTAFVLFDVSTGDGGEQVGTKKH